MYKEFVFRRSTLELMVQVDVIFLIFNNIHLENQLFVMAMTVIKALPLSVSHHHIVYCIHKNTLTMLRNNATKNAATLQSVHDTQ